MQSPDGKTILEYWGITPEDLTQLVNDNPSLRGMLMGYVAELKLTRLVDEHSEITESRKDDDHDRSRKGDRVVRYRGHELVLESKSLQTNSIKELGDGRLEAKAQVDASDRREVTFPDGSTLNTTLLLKGEFDVLAVNCFAFKEEWHWVFCKNENLPCSTYKKYTGVQREQLIASLVKVTWPPKSPFTENIFEVLDDLITSKPSGPEASVSA